MRIVENSGSEVLEATDDLTPVYMELHQELKHMIIALKKQINYASSQSAHSDENFKLPKKQSLTQRRALLEFKAMLIKLMDHDNHITGKVILNDIKKEVNAYLTK